MLKLTDDAPADKNVSVPVNYDELDHDELRSLVRAHADKTGLSIKAIGLQAGFGGESTFSAFINGSYKGDNEDKADKVRKWLRSERSIVRTKMTVPEGLKFTPTSASKKFFGTLAHAQALASVVVMTGAPGVGKTMHCEKYKQEHPNVWHLTAEPLLAGAFAIMEKLREVLGIPQTAPHRLSTAIATKVRGTQGLIIVDEAGFLEIKAIEQLRSVSDICKVGVAFVGKEEVWARIDGGGAKGDLSQLSSRVGMRVSVPKVNPKDVDIILDAAGIEDAEQRGQLRYIASQPGTLRGMAQTLRDARMLAAGGDGGKGEALTAGHIETAYNVHSGRTLGGAK